MSGRKCSEFRLQQEREEKLRLVQSIQALHAEASDLHGRTLALLSGASEGLRVTFSQEVQYAQRWLDRFTLPDVNNVGVDTALAKLRETRSALDRVALQGRQAREALTIAFTQKADELGQHLAKRLAEVEGNYISHRELLRLWCGAAQVQQWEEALREAQQLLTGEQYPRLEQQLEAITKDITGKSAWAEAQEDKQQKRLYLLKALRQVCSEMGFREDVGPHYERAGERGSSILLIVDTFDRGKIAFTLSLDEISTFSEIADNRCFEEFGQLSQYLADGFGVQTEFRLADGTPPPKRIHKGELDLPGGKEEAKTV